MNSFLPDFTLLVVDEFLKMNGQKEDIEFGRGKLLKTIQAFKRIYGLNANLICCSEFMNSEEYKDTFERVRGLILSSGLTQKILDTVPEKKRHIPLAREYPIHELACVKFLEDRAYSLKIGPVKERQYDEIMLDLGFKMSFAYILDALASSSKTPDLVVHYIPNSRGPNNGQRIFFEDEDYKVKAKLQQSCDEALRYFCKIASVSGNVLGKSYLDEQEINCLFGKKLKKQTVKLVLENIVNPYKEARK